MDHKAAYDGDKGPNTGGMGAISPSPLMTEKLHEDVMNSDHLPDGDPHARGGPEVQGRPLRRPHAHRRTGPRSSSTTAASATPRPSPRCSGSRATSSTSSWRRSRRTSWREVRWSGAGSPPAASSWPRGATPAQVREGQAHLRAWPRPPPSPASSSSTPGRSRERRHRPHQRRPRPRRLRHGRDPDRDHEARSTRPCGKI